MCCIIKHKDHAGPAIAQGAPVWGWGRQWGDVGWGGQEPDSAGEGRLVRSTFTPPEAVAKVTDTDVRDVTEIKSHTRARARTHSRTHADPSLSLQSVSRTTWTGRAECRRVDV